MVSKKITGQSAGNRLRVLQKKANKLYQELTDTIRDVNESIDSFYQTSNKYAKVLKDIEIEAQKPRN